MTISFKGPENGLDFASMRIPRRTCPVLGLKFDIYDQPANPYTIEGARDFRDGDVQDFLSAVLRDGEGDFHLYCRVNAKHVASGTSALRSTPFDKTFFPYRTTAGDPDTIRQALQRGAEHLRKILPGQRDFATAVDLYFIKTSV